MNKKEIQAITEKKAGKLIAIASTEDQDRGGDVLSVRQWDFTKFLMNPVLQAGHDYRPQYTVGIAKNLRIEGKQVVFEPVFHTITPLAKQIKEMYEQGFLKAWSVGFIPAQDKNGLHELLEVSAVAVPANAYALMKGFSASDVELETEVKSWMNKELESPKLKKAEEKVLMEKETSEEEGHKHTASFDDITGDGSTDSVNDHVHEIKNFKLATVNGHTHTIDMTDVVEEEKKPSKKMAEVWNGDLPEVFNKEFDISKVNARNLSFENELLTKFFDVQVKNLFVNDFAIPSPLLGSYLAGFKSILEKYTLVDTRNWHAGSEYPPIYGMIQLNSEKTEDFLLQGMRFYQNESKNSLVVKFYPSWDGMFVTLISSNDKKEWNKEILSKVEQWVYDNNFLRGEKFALSGSFVKKGTKSWNDIIAEEKNIDAVKKSLKALDNNKSRGLLFIGPPGTGKTMTGKVLVDNVNSTFIWVSSKDMDRVGAVTAIKLGYKLARDLAPCILFMEDIDHWIREYAVDLLKTEMDGLQENKGIITILTSNNPELLPDALLDRPGRFHEIIDFALPTKEIRSLMIQRWAGVDEKVSNEMSDKTDGFSGAHIKELVEYAKNIAEDDKIELKDALTKSLEKLLQQKQLIERIRQVMKGFDIIEIKEGRVISKKNRTKIETARDALNEVLKIEDSIQDEKPIEASKEEITEKEIPKKIQKKSVSDDEIVLKALQSIVKISNQTLHERKKGRKSI